MFLFVSLFTFAKLGMGIKAHLPVFVHVLVVQVHAAEEADGPARGDLRVQHLLRLPRPRLRQPRHRQGARTAATGGGALHHTLI